MQSLYRNRAFIRIEFDLFFKFKIDKVMFHFFPYQTILKKKTRLRAIPLLVSLLEISKSHALDNTL